MTESRVLFGDILPQVPAATGAYLGVAVGGMVLVTVDGALSAGAVGHKDQVVFGEQDALFGAVDLALDGRGHLFALPDVKEDIGNFSAELEIHPRLFQVFLHGQNQRFVLVVAGELEGTEIRQPGDVVDETLEIQLHFQGAVPVFEGKHGAPVQPEGGIKHLVVKDIFDGLVVEVLVLGHEQFDDFHAGFLAQVELSVGMGVLSAVDGGTAKRIVGIVLVEPIELIQHRGPRRFQ